MRSVGAVVAAAAVALVLAPAVQAATVTIRTWPTDCSGKVPDCAPVVWYTAGAGESNDVLVTTTASGNQPLVHIHDAGADIALVNTGTRCTAGGPRDVDCAPPSSIPGDAVHFELGDGDDRLAVSAPDPKTFRVVADGGPGADELNAEGSTKGVRFGGGSGRDVLTGGPAADSFTGDGSFARDPYPATDVGAAPADDTINGGGGEDTLSYAGRRRGVIVDLRAHRGGQTGEHDSIANVEGVSGGSGPDRLAGDGGPNYLDGGGGDDVVSGRGGDDSLGGGSGINRLVGGAGDDTLGVDVDRSDARTFSVAACGPGRDRVWGIGGSAEIHDDCELAGGDAAYQDYRLLGPLRTARSRAVQLNSQCQMTGREQQRHMVCQWRLALVTGDGTVVGVRSARTNRLPGGQLVRIPVRLNRLGRRLLEQRGSLRVKVRVATGLTRQHGPILTPATTVFTTVIRLKR